MFADPTFALADWRARWQFESEQLGSSAKRAAHSANKCSGLTAERLRRLASGYEAQRQHLAGILTELLHNAPHVARETHIALRTRLPSHHALNAYPNNICRDWVWGNDNDVGDDENLRAARFFQRHLPNPADQGNRILILGCGAGRLARDIAAAQSDCTIIALDSNPLLVLAANQLCHGKTLPFVEFPIAPRDLEDVAIHHQLNAGPAMQNLTFCLADALRAPFANAQFDAVITQWMVDVIDAPLAVLAGEVNRLLAPEGRWLNQGSWAFNKAEPAENLSVAEAQVVLKNHGFALDALESGYQPYMNAPRSRHHRQEELVSWQLSKTTQSPEHSKVQHYPEWLVSGRAPVPLSESFRSQAMATRLHAFIMTLVDGQKTLKEMAQDLERANLMPAKDAEQAVRRFLMKMYDDARLGG